MRALLSLLLSVSLLFLLIFAGAGGRPAALPRTSAWWGLLFPALFGQPGADAPVTFTWPGVTYVLQVLRLWA